MAGIPLSALRRALAEMSEGAGMGVRQAYGGRQIDTGIAYGGLPGAIGGGALGAQVDDDNPMTNHTGAGMVLGAVGGSMLGGGAGGLAKLISMGARGAGGGAAGLSRGLREALAEAAAERGVGRAALRDSEHADDAMRFHGMGDDSELYDEAARTGTPVSELRSRGSFEGFGERFQPGPLREFSNDELRAAGQRPSARYGSGNHQMDGGRANGMVEMQEMQAMRNALGQLRRSRMQAASQEELDDIDMQIAVLQRDLDIIPWD